HTRSKRDWSSDVCSSDLRCWFCSLSTRTNKSCYPRSVSNNIPRIICHNHFCSYVTTEKLFHRRFLFSIFIFRFFFLLYDHSEKLIIHSPRFYTFLYVHFHY